MNHATQLAQVSRNAAPSPQQQAQWALEPLLNTLPLSIDSRESQLAAVEAFGLSLTVRHRGLTPAKAQHSPLLAQLKRDDPGGLAEGLGNLLAFTAQQFNVVRNLTDMQITLLVSDLMQRYWMWRIDEFVYVCREGITGKWGRVLDRLDANVIQSWCTAYAETEQGHAIADAGEIRAAEYKQQALAAQGDAATMHKLYLRQNLRHYRPDQLLNLQRWLAEKYPGRDELLEAVSEEDAELCRLERLEAKREAEMREKVRKMLSVAEGFAKTPGEKEFAAGHITILPSLPPKTKHFNENEWENVKDRFTSAEEAA